MVKMRKNTDRFNGVTEEELYQRSLDDRIDFNLDIVFVNICPGLYSVYKGHHYSGPGNHFWRCLYDSGLTNRVLKSSEDYKIFDFRMGLVNMSQKPNIKSCQELTNEEIKEAQDNLNKRIRLYKPKIVAFNGKGIYEIYMGQSVDKEFNFGKQPMRFSNNTTDSYMFVLPSSSARCSQLPKVADKVPFYLALKKFRMFLNGQLSELSDADIMFPDFKVALEVSKEEASALNNSVNNNKKHHDSDSEGDDTSMMDDHNDTLNTPVANNHNHKIKFVRLNNIPFSAIPQEIMETLRIQRQSKKNVTIITKSKDYFFSNMKKTNFLSTFNSTAAATPSTITTVSDVDTASMATSDSSDAGANSNHNYDSDHFNNTNGSAPKQVNSKPTSKLSSLILNVCNSANGHATSPSFNLSNAINGTSFPTTPKTIHTTPIQNSNHKINGYHHDNYKPINDIKPNDYQKQNLAPIINTNKTPSSNATIKQILAAPLGTQAVNGTPKSNHISANLAQVTASQQTPIINIHQSKIQTPISSLKPKPTIATTPVITTSPIQTVQVISAIPQIVQTVTAIQMPTFAPVKEDDLLIDYEILTDEKCSISGYYTFEPSNYYYPASVVISEDYAAMLKNDLERVIHLHYDDQDNNSQKRGVKRNFASITDAHTYFSLTNEHKKECSLGFFNL